MSTPEVSAGVREGLPRRDFAILPLLSFFTILALFALSEVIARFVWQENEIDSCAVHTVQGLGDRYKPNCSSNVKLAEGPWVQNNYNECGYRSGASCRSKPPHAIRIALLGSSVAVGYMVRYEQTFGALTEKELTRQCGRPVEIQNLGTPALRWWQLAGRVDEALALRPDVVAIILSPNDLLEDSDPGDLGRIAGGVAQAPVEPKRSSPLQSLAEALPLILRHSRTLLMMRHFLYEEPEVYLRIYLGSHGDSGDYLRTPYTPLWRKRINNTDKLLGYLGDKVHSQNTPVLLVPALFYPQVALLNSTKTMPGTDVHAFESEVARVAAKHGIMFFDMLGDFTHVPHSEALFYTANGHMTAQGQEIYARSFVRQIGETHFLEPFGCAVGPPTNLTDRDTTAAGQTSQPSSFGR